MMNKMLRTIFVFCFILIASSCGKYSRIENGGYTKVTFHQNHDPTASTLGGGVMIYMYSPDFSTNLMLTDENAGANITIPNGPYSIYAFGYTATFGNHSSPDNNIRCAVKTGIALTGTAITIPLTMKQTDCSNGAFTGDGTFVDSNSSSTIANSGALFPQVDVVHCSTAASAFLANSANANTNCAAFVVASAARYRISLPVFSRNGGGFNKLSSGLSSDCVGSFASNAGLTASSEYTRLPLGSSSMPFLFPVEIVSYTDSSCTSTPIMTNTFYKGLIFGPSPGTTNSMRIFPATNATGKARMFLSPL